MSLDPSQDPQRAAPDRLLKSTSVVAAFTFLSRLTGLARDIAFSNWFGAGVLMDAVVVAFTKLKPRVSFVPHGTVHADEQTADADRAYVFELK